MSTLQETFFSRMADSAKRPYIQYKKKRSEPFESITYGEFGERAKSFASVLTQAGISNGERILLVSESCPEWLITDFGSILSAAITVPIFPTLTSKQIEFILQDSGAIAAVVSNEFQLRKIINCLEQTPKLRIIIVIDQSVELPSIPNISLYHFAAFESKGIAHALNPQSTLEDDIVTIIYTSGTTGTPKGVMLTHRNLTSNVNSALQALPQLTSEEVFLSFLPLCHAFERIASYLQFTLGCQVAFAESIDTIADNMLEIRPTIMTAVPRFFERLSDRIDKNRYTLSSTKKSLFDWAIRVGKQYGEHIEHKPVSLSTKILFPLANALVLKRIKARTGGRIKFFVSGGAKLNPELGKKFAAFGLYILEGYGLTETSPIVAVNRVGQIKWGTVGAPLPGVIVKIADDGEILISGANVMKGYFNSPDETANLIDNDGWLHSGDIGLIDEHGSLKITDRKKHIIVLANGKNIAPAPIELVLESSPLISQAVVIGEGRDYCIALIVANADEVGKNNLEEIKKPIGKEVNRFNKDLSSFEKIRKFEVIIEPFSVENGMMTPTLKIRRKEVEKRYQHLINSLYQEIR